MILIYSFFTLYLISHVCAMYCDIFSIMVIDVGFFIVHDIHMDSVFYAM